MSYLKYPIIICLILSSFTSAGYSLTNSWCSSGKYSMAISPFPKPDSNKCPGYAKIIMSKKEVEEYYINGLGQEYLCTRIKSGDLFKQKDREDYKAIIELIKGKDTKCDQFFKNKLAEKKAEEEARIRALAEKLAKEEIARDLIVKQKEEEEAKQKALAKKKAEELAKQKALAAKKAKEDKELKKALAKKKAEEIAKQKALAAKKAKEDKERKKALAKKKAEELAKQKAIAAKKAEEEKLKKKALNEKIQKIKDEANFVVASLKEYVTKDTNKLDILEVSELLENYNTEMQKGWSDKTLEKYEKLYDYVEKDQGFIDFSAEKKSKQLAAYNEEIIQLREYLTISLTKLKAFIAKNLGSKNAKKAVKLAKETKQILKDFEVSKAMTLKNNIATWKAMNGVEEDKKYTFKLLNKKVAEKKQSVIKKFTQNKLANNAKKNQKTNLQTNKDPSFTDVIFKNKWQLSKAVKCSSGSYRIYDKKNGNISVFGGKKQISPNPTEVKIFQIDNNKIRIETKIFSNNMFKKLNGGKTFLIYSITEVITVLKGNQIETKKTLKRIDTSRFMNNPRDKIYKTTQERGSSVSCGLLPGAKKGNQSSQANTVQQNQKKNKAKKLKSNLSKPNHKDSIFRKADNLKALAGKCYLSVPSVYRSTIASLYSNANKMYNNGVKFIKMKQTDTAINMLRSANDQFKNMIRVGRQVGGRSC